MPKLTLVLERKPVRVYEVDQPVIAIGRAETMDIVIDNVSVSRRQAQIRQEEDGSWTVRDFGSANGTFLNGQQLTSPQLLNPGDEISFGKFSLFFDRVFAAPHAEPDLAPRPAASPVVGTFELGSGEVEKLQQAVALKRQAQLEWETGGVRGTHYIKGGAVLVGRTPLCDLQVPAGPKQDILVMRGELNFEVRNLSGWHRMKVNGQTTERAGLKSGDTIETGGLRLTFLDEVR